MDEKGKIDDKGENIKRI